MFVSDQSLLSKLSEIEARYNIVNEALSSPDISSDIQKMKLLSKEYKELGKIISVGRDWRRLLEMTLQANELLNTESDEEIRAMAKEELDNLSPKLALAEGHFKQLLIPKDPDDSKNVIMEIRAGTGGDEASLFAGDLFEMYRRFCEKKRWKFEVTEMHEGTVGGFKEVIINISGEDAYGTLKYESGVHRVQRVPQTETQGRVHTSAASVAVLPEAEDLDIEILDSDIEKETFCASGNGGQGVNTTKSAVRLTHLPSGIVVSMQNERSQIKNYELALKILRARLYEQELAKRQADTDAQRRSMVSTGDRSAKIRTYNYPQSRVTDHRIGMTVYNLQAVMDGELDEFIEALRIADNAARMAEGNLVKA